MKTISDDKKALALESQSSKNETMWAEVAPILDDALTSLAEADREAIILHFYHGLGYREVGERIGRREDATRKRVKKALERMASFFKRQGVAFPVAALTAGLGVKLSSTAHANGSLSAVALASKALSISTPATGLATKAILTMSSLKSTSTILTAALLFFLSLGAGYLTGHQRGSTQHQEIADEITERGASRRSNRASSAVSKPPNPPVAQSSLRTLLSDIVRVSGETDRRPSAWPEVLELRRKILGHQFEEALEIAHKEYANDEKTMKKLVQYLLTDWSRHDGEAATLRAAEYDKGDSLERMLSLTVDEWGKQSGKKAIDWLTGQREALGSGAELRLSGFVYGGWASSDPDGALDAFEALDYDRQRAVVSKLWMAAQDESARGPFIERVSQVSDERLRVDIFEKSISESLHDRPLEVAIAYDQLKFTDESIRRRALDHVTDKLFSDPEMATKWIWERAIDDDHRSAILKDWVASGWALQDRPAVEKWLIEEGYSPEEWLRKEES